MKKINTNIFIKRSNLIHKNFYDYSQVNYVNCKTKVKIVCKKHGNFEQTPDSHLNGSGCPICGQEKTKLKQLKKFNLFIDNANNIHNDKYDYSITNYLGARRKIKIICKKHGIFTQTPDSHLHGRGCPKCVNRNCNTTEFIEKANLIHNYSYNYEKVKYSNPKTKIIIICLKHGEFKQTPNSHLNGSGCPICKASKGEIIILNYLKNNNIKFVREKRFFDCKNKYRLPFDFYLPEHNMLIEYDGEQHERPVNFFGISDEISKQNFLKLKINDSIKTTYAETNSIKLIRVSYEIKNVEFFLKNNMNLGTTKII